MICLELFAAFFTIGLFTFGGGHAMIPMIQSEVVSRGWTDMQTVVDFIGVAESTPGPFAVNMATFIGNHMGGFAGAVCATLGVILPSFIIIILVARFFYGFRENKWVQYAFAGLKPAVVGLIAYAAYSVVKTGLSVDLTGSGAYLDIKAAAIFAVIAALSIVFKKLHPAVLIGISAVLGVILYGYF